MNEPISTNIKVSVCIVTYNQERYIADCIESILNQKVSFNFEILIADDASTDNTRAIIQWFAEQYPFIVRPIFQENNLGPSKNYSVVHAAASGDYVAHIDGDDYMLQGKLQRQVDFLDQHLDCSYVTHRVYVVGEDGKKILRVAPRSNPKKISTITDLITHPLFFVHSSKMYRRKIAKNHYDKDMLIDFYLHLEHASQGNIGFISEALGVYRVHGGGITQVKDEKLYALIDATAESYESSKNFGVPPCVADAGKKNYLFKSAIFCLSRNDIDGFKRYIEVDKKSSLLQQFLYQLKDKGILLRLMRYLLLIRQFAMFLGLRLDLFKKRYFVK